MLREVTQKLARRSDGEQGADATALAAASAVLDDRRDWLPTFRRYKNSGIPRLVVIPTWQYELRGRHCYMPKHTAASWIGARSSARSTCSSRAGESA